LKFSLQKNIDERTVAKWNRFIEVHPHGSVLQSWFIYQLFDQTRNFDPVLILCVDAKEDIQGVLLGTIIREQSKLKQVFSSRLVVYGGPLVNEHHPEKREIVDFLLENLIRQVRKKSIFVQFRASYDLSGYKDVFNKYNFNWVPRLNLLIDTTQKEKLVKEISASKRRQIKKSLASGARVIEPESIDQVRDFYEILYDLYRHRVRKPLPDLSFFEAFYALIKFHNNGKFFLIDYDNRIIGGIMSPYLAGKSVFEWYVCGLDAEFKSRGIYPSALATWAAIEHACKSGCKIFDFMGVGKPDEPYGVRDFKMKFGGTCVNYGRYIRINSRLKYAIAELGYNFLTFIKKV
jgi:serine/alanine adding enzyme